MPPIPDPDKSCGPECAVAHTTVLPVDRDLEQLCKHALVDGHLRGLALWRQPGARGPVVHVVWVDADMVVRQEYVAADRVEVLAST